VIVVTTGTNETPFDRLVAAAGMLAGDERVVVQHGSSRLRPAGVELVDFLAFDELAALVEAARVVVTHAGVGSVMLALRRGSSPIMMPRRAMFGEAVDDHQATFARRIARTGAVRLVEDAAALVAAVRDPRPAAATGFGERGPGALHRELEEVIGTGGRRVAARA
jgi:exopolysaccharide biosynthesis glucuronosyltransferase PssE